MMNLLTQHPELKFGYFAFVTANALVFSKLTIKQLRSDLAQRRKANADYERYLEDFKQWDILPLNQKSATVMPSPSNYYSYTYYSPELTLRHLVLRILGTITPGLNIGVLLWNIPLIGRWIVELIDWIMGILDKPVINKRKH